MIPIDDISKKDSYAMDKPAVFYVLAGLMRNPQLLSMEQYPLSIGDFPTRFHRILFMAIASLAQNGADNITPLLVDEYISHYPVQYNIFTVNNGVAYLERVLDGFEDNFDLSYQSLKKHALLTALHDAGVDISEYYNPDTIGVEETTAIHDRLAKASLVDIFQYYQGKMSAIEDSFNVVEGRQCIQASKGMKELKESLKAAPEFGAPMNSKKLATICRGRRRRKFYLRTLPSGVGKTRLSLADACLISIPQTYDPNIKRWIKSECREPTLFITTELEPDEVQTMVMAYVACVPEEHILNGKYDKGEEKRVDKAIDIIAESPFWIEHIPQFDMDDIEKLIREHKRKHNVTYVFFDYLYTSTKALMEIARKTRFSGLREDNALAMFSDRMKMLCNTLDVHISTSTQANGDWKTAKDPDQNLIRGSKAIADKVDIGYVGLEPTEADIEATRKIMESGGRHFFLTPNLVYHVYKVRRGRLNHVKVFVNFDYATLRTTDLFVTDRQWKLLDVESTDIETILCDTEEIDDTQEEETTIEETIW